MGMGMGMYGGAGTNYVLCPMVLESGTSQGRYSMYLRRRY